MVVSTKGIVLRKTPYNDTSVILKVYTDLLGIKSFIYRPGKKSGKARYDAMQLLNLSFMHQPSKNLAVPQSMEADRIYSGIYSDMDKLSFCHLINEVLIKCLKEEEANPELFDYLTEQLIYLDACKGKLSFFMHKFLIDLTYYLGFYPSVDTYDAGLRPFFDPVQGVFVSVLESYSSHTMNKDYSAVLAQLCNIEKEDLSDLSEKLSNKGRFDLLKSLLMFYALHVEGFGELKSLEIIEATYQ